MPLSSLSVQSFGPRPIDTPVHALTGPFANRTVRAVLDEVQKADIGRKCGNRDRRPLDPPPVVRLRLFETVNDGTPLRTEREITDVNSEAVAYGYTCFVELFPWPPSTGVDPGIRPAQQWPSPASADGASRSQTVLPSLASFISGLVSGPSNTPTAAPYASQGRPAPDLDFLRLPSPHALTQPLMVQRPPSAGNIAAIVNGVIISEDTNCTHAFVGATFVSASCFTFEGKPTLLFVFPDLACNMDGTFLLRYRAMNLFGGALETGRRPVVAECWGGPATVYPTKDFPGLTESTDLTKYLSRFGVPVNIRQGERKKRVRCVLRDRPQDDRQYFAGRTPGHV